MPALASTMEERSSVVKSLDTTASSVYLQEHVKAQTWLQRAHHTCLLRCCTSEVVSARRVSQGPAPCHGIGSKAAHRACMPCTVAHVITRARLLQTRNEPCRPWLSGARAGKPVLGSRGARAPQDALHGPLGGGLERGHDVRGTKNNRAHPRMPFMGPSEAALSVAMMSEARRTTGRTPGCPSGAPRRRP